MECQLLKIEETAKVLGIGRSKAYEMVRRRELPIVRIGGSVRVPATELRRWIEQKTEGVDDLVA